MGLRETISSAVDTAFTATGDLKTSITVRYKQNPVFNTTTLKKSHDAPSGSNQVTIGALVGPFESIKDDETPVLPTDKKVTINANDLVTRPSLVDKVVIGSVEHEIVKDRSPIGDFIYVLQVRDHAH